MSPCPLFSQATENHLPSSRPRNISNLSQTRAAFLVFALFVPFSVSLADDEVTQALHANTYQESGQASCTAVGGCAVIFPATEHTTTVITAMSCYAEVDQGAVIIFAALGDSSFGPVKFYVQPFYSASGGSHDIYQVGASTNLYFGVRKKPVVQFFTQSGVVRLLQCTITGYHS